MDPAEEWRAAGWYNFNGKEAGQFPLAAGMIIDSHVHLDAPQFNGDLPDIIRRGQDAGVELFLNVAMATPEGASLTKTLALAEAHDSIYAAIGVHPDDARVADAAYLERLARQAEHPKVVLWGEIGLDYHGDCPPRDRQQAAFRTQIRLARENNLPVSIHCHEAWPDLLEILKQESKGNRYRGILHSFSGDPEHARQCVDLGLLISFSGIVSFRNAAAVRAAARGLRLDQILVESDAPYVAPEPHRGKRNEPAFVIEVARTLAQVMDVTLEDIARNTTSNFRHLIKLPSSQKRDVLVYPIRDRLYINLTNRCTAHCVFCRRETDPVASGYDLRLEREHSPSEYLEAIGNPRRYAEIIFCGFGEPTLRLKELVEMARALKTLGSRLRMNTNGHGNLIHGRDIVPDLAPYLDEISVSIDAGDAATYQRLVRPDFGTGSFQAVVDFIRACVGRIPNVTLTAIDLPGIDLEPIRRLARELGADFRPREYQPMVGSTDFTKDR